MIRTVLAARRWRPAIGAASLAALVAAVILLRPAPQVEAADKPAGNVTEVDLSLVPADAAGFVHIRLADLWKNEMFSGLRKTWERAGEKAIATLDKQFVPAPSSLDRATVFAILDEKTHEPQVFGIAAFSAAFDPAELVKVYWPDAKKSQANGKAVYTDQKKGISVAFPDNRHVLVGMAGTVESLLSRPAAKSGPMAAPLKLAASGRPLVAAVNIAALPIPPDALNDVPEEFRPALRAEQVVISADLGAEARLEVRAVYKDAAATAAAEKAIRAAVGLGRMQLDKAKKELEAKLYDPNLKTPRPPEELPEAIGTVFGLGALGRIDDMLADPKLVTRSGNELAFSASMPKEIVTAVSGFGAIGIGMLLPAVQKVREAAARAQSQNNLKQIGIAIMNYCGAFDGKMPADITDKNGKPLLSWRVQILPYIEQQALYQQFKLDEPWDSEHNKKLSQMVVKTYLSPLNLGTTDKNGYALTNYKGIAGPGGAFERGKKVRFPASFTDGTSNTIMVLEDENAIPWAKPGDFTYDPKKLLPKINAPGMTNAFHVAMGDGSVRLVNTKVVSEKTLKALFTMSGNEILGPDW